MADAPSQRGAPPPRPLSPHLQIYKPLINMVMSILHRITGVALYFGTLLLCWWLIAAATNADYFNYVSSWFKTWPGQLIMVGYTWALLHHMIGGLRHFIWDTGRGYDLETIDRLSWGSIIISLVGTGAVWLWVASAKGII
jgi:succinate dehydrogenase / fumarate reductase, cytochrome b subunit